MEILRVENLTFCYPNCKENAVSDASFDIKKGEFIAVCGSTGSGKSSLLRLLKRELIPQGTISGNVFIENRPQSSLSDAESAKKIGYVTQRPEQQIVTDKVWHELAFGLENLGLPQNVIARRIAEMATYFGIEDWYDKKVSELSGGQKQLLNLASVMVMQPEILILDEPTAQLDPIAASDFISTIKKINRELSLTVIIAEHRLEEIIPVCDRLLVLEKGKIAAFEKPRTVIESLKNNDRLMLSMPAPARLYHYVSGDGTCPLDVREGRNFIESNFNNSISTLPKEEYAHSSEAVLEMSDVCFRYEKNSADILKSLNLTVYKNEIFCILGGNGSGKTTSLLAASGLIKPYSGKIKVFGKKIKDYKNHSLYRECLTLLPQDVQTVFLKNTVAEELAGSKAELPFDIKPLYEKHPYDLSGGEQQLVALAKALSTNPKLLLLDEPTKGLDAHAKSVLTDILKALKKGGMTIVIVTHDVEFASLCADRAALFFGGNIVSEGVPTEFFSENNFYTTAANLMARGFFSNITTVESLARLCLMNKNTGGENV